MKKLLIGISLVVVVAGGLGYSAYSAHQSVSEMRDKLQNIKQMEQRLEDLERDLSLSSIRYIRILATLEVQDKINKVLSYRLGETERFIFPENLPVVAEWNERKGNQKGGN